MKVEVIRLVTGAPDREFGSLSRIGKAEKKRTISFERVSSMAHHQGHFYI